MVKIEPPAVPSDVAVITSTSDGRDARVRPPRAEQGPPRNGLHVERGGRGAAPRARRSGDVHRVRPRRHRRAPCVDGERHVRADEARVPTPLPLRSVPRGLHRGGLLVSRRLGEGDGRWALAALAPPAAASGSRPTRLHDRSRRVPKRSVSPRSRVPSRRPAATAFAQRVQPCAVVGTILSRCADAWGRL